MRRLIAVEQAIVHGIRASLAHARITVAGVPDHPGAAAAIFAVVAECGANLGLASHNRATVTFTLARPDGPAVLAALRAARPRIGFLEVILGDAAIVTLTGAGLRSDPTIAPTFCEALARTGLHLEIVAIENAQISVACPANHLHPTVHALREAFEVSVAPPLPEPRPRSALR